MSRNEFETWLSRNIGKGGKLPSADLFNKSKKGSERAPKASEYPFMGKDEYSHYPERASLKREEDKKQQEQQSEQSDRQNDRKDRKDQSRSRGNSGANASSGAVQASSSIVNVVTRVVAAGAGAVVVANGYEAMGGELPWTEKPVIVPPIVASQTWNWSEDHSAATVQLLDKDGSLIIELPASVDFVATEETCKDDGFVVYTATAEYDGETYKDKKTEAGAKALGHTYGEAEYKTLENGDVIVVFKCTRCGDEFSNVVSHEEKE